MSKLKKSKRTTNNKSRLLAYKKLQEQTASIHYEYRVEEVESTAVESVLNKLFQIVEQENNSGSA